MVVLVHDGPWSRASLEYSAQTQWLATRGYGVLNVNYRGSTGFGKKFLNAGNGEWGGKMSDDLIDAVRWAVDQKIADPAKVAVAGSGYGGYAALEGMETGGDTFACGVDLSGPSNLVSFLPAVPPDATSELGGLAKRVGDWRTDEGKKLLTERSPVAHMGAIKNPILIGQGKDDPRTREWETASFAAALKGNHRAVTYAMYPDEEDELMDPANRTSFSALTEIFLAQCLGGAYQALGSDITTGSITIPVGARYIYGMHEQAPPPPPEVPAAPGSAAPPAPPSSAAPAGSGVPASSAKPAGSAAPASSAPPASSAAPAAPAALAPAPVASHTGAAATK